MAAKSSSQEIVYEEFEPFCKWQRKEDRDVLEIQLQGFKKEELKVQISNHGVLKILGERVLDPPQNSKRSKFYKEVPAPTNKYDTHAIHAKFVDSNLIITLPKPKPDPKDDKAAPSEPPKLDHPPKPKRHDAGAKEDSPDHAATGQCRLDQLRKKPVMGSRLTKVAASLAATAVAAAVLAAYVHYMYKSTVDNVDD